METESGQFRNCGHFFTHRVSLSSSPSQPSSNVLHNLAALCRIRQIPGHDMCLWCDASSKLMRWDNARRVEYKCGEVARVRQTHQSWWFICACLQMVLEHDKCVSRRVCVCVRVVIEIYNYRKCISNFLAPPPSPSITPKVNDAMRACAGLACATLNANAAIKCMSTNVCDILGKCK